MAENWEKIPFIHLIYCKVYLRDTNSFPIKDAIYFKLNFGGKF